ncbi:hypothetical protein AB0M47_04865 [Hamadaea sp. NPDC051192]|uniref:hypothetical protein n=1 Tax=Hamadaea sp. NPDC051192 TaxID=3154940 RepID=UPI003430E631
MDHHTALNAAAKRFPLLGRPRPDCPPLRDRIAEVTRAADDAVAQGAAGLPDAAHALNKAALIASDGGETDLAHTLCWQHINAYRTTNRPLTTAEAQYMLEPVLNLARLRLRAHQGEPALHLLHDMHQAIAQHTDLTIDGTVLPMANLVGDHADRRTLRTWTWLQLLGEGIRALVLAGRWNDAAHHAHTLNGVGAHLMDGRQAAIVAACLDSKLHDARTLLAEATPTQPWEVQVASCLHAMTSDPASSLTAHHLAIARRGLDQPSPGANYASYRAKLGLTVAILTSPIDAGGAGEIVHRLAVEAIATADGYAARDVLLFREPIDGITTDQHAALEGIVQRAGLGKGQLRPAQQQDLARVAATSANVIQYALNAAAP